MIEKKGREFCSVCRILGKSGSERERVDAEGRLEAEAGCCTNFMNYHNKLE